MSASKRLTKGSALDRRDFANKLAPHRVERSCSRSSPLPPDKTSF